MIINFLKILLICRIYIYIYIYIYKFWEKRRKLITVLKELKLNLKNNEFLLKNHTILIASKIKISFLHFSQYFDLGHSWFSHKGDDIYYFCFIKIFSCSYSCINYAVSLKKYKYTAKYEFFLKSTKFWNLDRYIQDSLLAISKTPRYQSLLKY